MPGLDVPLPHPGDVDVAVGQVGGFGEGTEQLGVLPGHRGLEQAGPALPPGREQAERELPGLVELLLGAQLDVLARRLGPEQVGEDALPMVGVVEEQQQVAQADQRVGTVGRAGQRIRAAVYIAHHVDSHITTVSRPGRKIVTQELIGRRSKLELPNNYPSWRDAVREISLPALVEIPATANLASTVFRRAAEQPQAVALRRPGPLGRSGDPQGSEAWTDVTAGQFRDEVVAVAKGLVAAGIEAGDRV